MHSTRKHCLALALALAVTASLFSACSKSDEEPTADNNGTTAQTTKSETTTKAETTKAETTTEEETTEPEPTGGPYLAELLDFNMTIDGDSFKFPMTVADIEALGWSLASPDDADGDLNKNTYQSTYFKKGDLQINLFSINTSSETKKVRDCPISGGGFSGWLSGNPSKSSAVVILPGGIEIGKSTIDDIIAAYGEPTDRVEGKYNNLTYKLDREVWRSIQITVPEDLGYIGSFDIKNFIFE
jgi:hypothetical protein